MRIDVAYTPADARSLRPSGRCVVVDVLRATSSIVTAAANGCAGVVPVSDPADALSLADGARVLACGERNGVKIPGFHLGNSPREFDRDVVAGSQLVMCTTNGTKAIRAAEDYSEVLVGCMLNAPAVSERLAQGAENVTILCSGREGNFSLEDALCAGLLVSDLDGELSDAAVAAVSLYEACQDRVEEVLLDGEHGRFLQKIGFGDDISYCARIGTTGVIPKVLRSGQDAPYDLIIKAEENSEAFPGGK
jgi:2-phosphosulfolactate phosphatase